MSHRSSCRFATSALGNLILLVLCAPTAFAQADAPKTQRITPKTEATGVKREPRPDIQLPGHVITAEQRTIEQFKGTETGFMAGIRTIFGSNTPQKTRPHGIDYYVVRVSSTDIQEGRKRIEATGAEVLKYVPSSAFVVKMKGAVAATVADLEIVEWHGRYKTDYRISKSLLPYLSKPRVSRPTGAEPPQERTRVPPPSVAAVPERETKDDLTITVTHFPGAEIAKTVDRIVKGGGAVLSSNPDRTEPIVRARVSPRLVQRLAEIPEVSFVEWYSPQQTRNDIATSRLGIPAVRAEFGLSGAGEIVGHADTGLDIGDQARLHPDLASRLHGAAARGRIDDWSDEDGHGTHTAASILGTGDANNGAYRGAAPGAMLFHQSLADAEGVLAGIPTTLDDLLDQAYAAGARIHSDSWGSVVTAQNGLGGAYTDHAEDIDRWLWNAGDPRDMLIVVAGGNDGELGAGSIGPPATAKNCLAVGAIGNNRPIDEYREKLTTFSSKGPTQDGRYKPDVVAPGSWIASARTQGEEIYFDDDMESGDTAWQLVLGSAAWDRVQGACFSGQFCLTDSPNSNYEDDQDTIMATPWISVESAATVRFRGRWDLVEPNDYGFFVAFDTGAGFHFASGDYFGLPPRNPSWPDWDLITLPIPDPFRRANRFRVGFNLYTDSAGHADGITIDDVRITTFSTWGDMSEAGLAQLEDTVDRHYTLMGGTSMATPLVAGAAALVREYFRKEENHAPSSTLLKAVLVNGAQPIPTEGARPNHRIGWGVVNLDAVLPKPPRALVYVDGESISDGQVQSFNFNVTDSSTELRATLVWHDPPGVSLIHDLSLTLQGPDGREWSMRQPDGTRDSINNVEGVDVENPSTGQWTVAIGGESVPAGPQPYSIVITGSVSR